MTHNRTPRRTADGPRTRRASRPAAVWLAIVLAAGAAQAANEAYTWRPLRVGAGGWITGIDIASDGTRVVRTDTYGAYKWNSGISEWEQLLSTSSMPGSAWGTGSGQGVYEIKIAPTSSSTMYMIYDGKAFKTTNGGTTWTHLSNFSQQSDMNAGEPTNVARAAGEKMAIDPNNANIVYVGTVSAGLRYTTDGGANWSSVSTGTIPNGAAVPGINAICFKDSNTIYVASWGNGTYRTINGGSSWTQISDGTGGNPTKVLHSACDNGNYYATNGTYGASSLWKYNGSTWSRVYTGGRAHSVAADPNVADRIVIGTDYGHTIISLDAGASWENDAYYNPTRISSDIRWHAWTAESYMSNGDMMFDPNAASGTLLFAQGIGVWKTDLSGTPAGSVPWDGMSKGIEQLVTNVVVAPPGESTVNLCGWDRGSFAMSDLETYPSQHGPIQTFSHCWGLNYVATDSTNPKLVQVNRYINDASAYSTDKGASWTDFPGNFASQQGGDIAASTDTNFVAYSGFNTGAYYTTDGGTSWTKVTDFGDNISYPVFLIRHIVAADHVTANKFWLYYADFTDPNAADTGVWKTTDGGASWTKVYSGFLVAYGNDIWNGTLRSVPGHEDHLFWTGGDNGGGEPAFNGYFMKSTDGGVNWSNVNANVLEVKAFGFGDAVGTYPRIYIAGWVSSVWGIWYSDDAGTNWTKIGDYPLGSFDTIASIDGAKDGSNRVYVGFRGSGYAYGVPPSSTEPPQAPILLP